MATYVTKRCPHCGHEYQFLKSGDQRKYGCPYQTCEKCNESYWDTDIKEPALYKSRKPIMMQKLIEICLLMILGPTALILPIIGALSVITGDIIIGIFIFVPSVCVSILIGKYIDYLERKIEEQERIYNDSKERLKDIDYLTALAQHDRLASLLLEKHFNK